MPSRSGSGIVMASRPGVESAARTSSKRDRTSGSCRERVTGSRCSRSSTRNSGILPCRSLTSRTLKRTSWMRALRVSALRKCAAQGREVVRPQVELRTPSREASAGTGLPHCSCPPEQMTEQCPSICFRTTGRCAAYYARFVSEATRPTAPPLGFSGSAASVRAACLAPSLRRAHIS